MMLMVKAIQTQQYKQLDARSNECRPGAQGRSPLLFIQLTNIATDVSTELLRKRMAEEGLPPTSETTDCAMKWIDQVHQQTINKNY